VKVYLVEDEQDWYPKLVSIHATREGAEARKAEEDKSMSYPRSFIVVNEYEVPE
jgi:hypothetical protein